MSREINRRKAELQSIDVVTIERPAPQPTGLLAEPIPLAVVYEDADLVVIDKPAGMVVHPAPGHPAGTLVNALLARYPDMAIGSDLRPGIVHRLDRDTSGLLVVARNERILHALQQQQQARTMIKIYLALVEGSFKELAGTIDAPIARHPTDRIRMAVVANGREARSHWQVREAFGEYTLLAVRLETGRTHQIRVHVSWKHHPIVGDPLYGPRRPRHTFGLKRQFLHAWRLGFVHPTSGMPVEWQSELPADLQAVLTRLRSRIR
ncbi:MAG TPA: RluA family pseudouridine synthase [Roseiflexaceae bacterium]|nr:RluA family pseudouridine synthase [Roseiflexaceae bacterium]